MAQIINEYISTLGDLFQREDAASYSASLDEFFMGWLRSDLADMAASDVRSLYYEDIVCLKKALVELEKLYTVGKEQIFGKTAENTVSPGTSSIKRRA